jgi:hypothetical protein
MRALKKKIYYEAKVNECKSSALQTPQRFLTSKSHTKEPKFCKLYHEASKKSCDVRFCMLFINSFFFTKVF